MKTGIQQRNWGRRWQAGGPGTSDRRSRHRRLLLTLLLMPALAACSPKEAGQMLYNTGKAYCEQQPQTCGGRPDGVAP